MFCFFIYLCLSLFSLFHYYIIFNIIYFFNHLIQSSSTIRRQGGCNLCFSEDPTLLTERNLSEGMEGGRIVARERKREEMKRRSGRR